MACSSRPRGTRFIFEAGVKLRFCDETIATACVYYHKFYQTMKSQEYNESLVVMAVLSLAGKAKEMPVKLSDVVNTCHRCLHRGGPLLEVGEVYWQLKDSVARYELLLLRALRFHIYLSMPHSHLVHYLLALSHWVDPAAWSRSRLASISLSLLQDTYHTSVHLSLPPQKMATAVLYLAVLCCRLPVFGNERSVRKWWEVLCPGTSEAELREVAKTIMAAYDQTPGLPVGESGETVAEDSEGTVGEGEGGGETEVTVGEGEDGGEGPVKVGEGGGETEETAGEGEGGRMPQGAREETGGKRRDQDVNSDPHQHPIHRSQQDQANRTDQQDTTNSRTGEQDS